LLRTLLRVYGHVTVTPWSQVAKQSFVGTPIFFGWQVTIVARLRWVTPVYVSETIRLRQDELHEDVCYSGSEDSSVDFARSLKRQTTEIRQSSVNRA